MKRAPWIVGLMVVGIGIYALIYHPSFVDQLFRGDIAKDDSTGEVNQKPVVTPKSETTSTIPKRLPVAVFQSIDAYAAAAPKNMELANLAEYLSVKPKNDLEKARVIYAWIAHNIQYDVKAYLSEATSEDQQATAVLRRKKAVCEGFSNLFLALATAMKLEAVKIIGYAKGFSYQKGQRFSETNHAWNAVKIDGDWKLIDATWGSGYVVEVNKKLMAKKELEDYWFCTDPNEFIFSHFSEDPTWQLRATPITLQQYEKIPGLYPPFFKVGFNSRDAFQKIMRDEVEDFVTCYPTEFPVKCLNFPMEKNLVRGDAYTFQLQSEYAHQIALINDGEWIYFNESSDTFKIEYVVKGKSLRVLQKINAFDKSFTTIAEYVVRK